MKRHISIFAFLLGAFAAVGLSAFAAGSGSDVMRLSPVGYRLGEAGGVTSYDPSVVTVTPGDTSIVSSNKPVTLTADLNRDYKVVRWQKFDVDPTVRTGVDPIEEFGEESGTVSVGFNPNVTWMYVTVVVKYDPVRTVKVGLSSFAKGTVTVNPEKTSYQRGDVVTLTAEPADGYSFVRWSDGNPDHTRTLTVDDDIDLKAYIEPDSSRVSFSAGADAVLDVTSKRVSFGNAYGELPVPTRTGAKFSGWMDDEKRTVTAKTEVNRVADHTLFASWSDLLYEIDWDFTGRGNGKVDGAGTYAYGSQPTLKAVPYEGSAFIGWADGVTLNPRRITVLSNALYVASFDVATYDVTFTYRDASGNLVTIGPTTVEHGGKIDPPTIPEWPEHTFKNWSTEEYKKVTRDLAVEAIYDAMTYSVAFAYRDWQGNCVTTMPQHVTAGGSANPPDRSVADNWAGHTLRGWQPDYNVIRQDTICEALYDDVRCMVKFSYRDKDGNLMAENVQVNYGEAVLETSVPPKSKVDQWPDHEFLGWDERYAEATNCVTDDLTVNARYKDVITVIYSPGKGQGDRQEFDLEEEGSYVILNPTNDLNYSRVGYAFDYWQSDDKKNYQPGDTVKLKAGDTLALTASWANNKYTIKFDGNGGECHKRSQTEEYDRPRSLSFVSGDFDHGVNYEFVGLGTNREEVLYAKPIKTPIFDWQPVVSNLTTEANATVTLYAIWQGMSQEVKINGVTTNIAYGSQLQQPPDPVKPGYTFDGGWTTNGVPVTFPITVTGSFKLNSEDKWTPIRYTVVFNGTDSDGGAMEPQEFTYDVAQALTSNGFTRTGYTFANWTNEIGTIFADGAQVKNLATNDGEVVDLYATWTMNPHYYAVAFDGNGADGGSMATNRFECGKGGKLPANAFTRTGYAFNQWTNETATGMSPPLLDDGATFTEDLAPTNGTATLKALWVPNRYWVKFDGNGGAGSMAAQEFTYDAPQALTSNAFTRTGYGFAGWATNATATGMSPPLLADGAVVSNLTAVADATNTLFAAWTPNKYTVVIDGVATNMDYGSDIKRPSAPAARDGYTFTGWTTNGVPVADWPLKVPLGGLEISSAWTTNAYTVRFNPGEGGGTMADQAFTYGEPQALEANRFTAPEMMVFDCWTNTVDSTTYANCATVCNLATGGVFVLYATWKDAPSYAVAFDGNGADGGSMATNRFECGKGGTLAKNRFEKTGYSFSSWTNETATGMSPPLLGDGATFTVDLAPTNGTATLKALWATNRYWVAFDGNGGAGSMSAQEFTYDAPQALTSNKFTRTGYGFAGWATNATATGMSPPLLADGAVVSNLTAEADATNTFWAAWTANSYKVLYNPNGGSGSVVTQDFTYAQAQPLAQNTFEPPQTWMVFAGWSNATDKVVYNAGASVSNLTEVADGIVDLYAVWGDDSYTVTFDGNGGVGVVTPQIFKHGSTDQLAPNAFTRIGHSFRNWTNEFGGVYGDRSSFTAPFEGIGETLYAVWTNNVYQCKFDSDTRSKKYGEAINPPPEDPTKTGYAFKGWTTNGVDKIDFTWFTMPAHDVVFTSMWGPITYTVEFDANGGTGSPDKIDATYDQSFQLASSNDVTWSGHEFVSWTNVNGQAWKSDAIVSNLTTIANTNVTLYAKWQETGNQLSIALGLDPNFEVEVNPDGAWEIIGKATDKQGLRRLPTSPNGTLRVRVPSAGKLNFTFDVENIGGSMMVKFEGAEIDQFGDDATPEYEPDSAEWFEFSGTPSNGSWTLKNFKWTAK